MRKLTPPLALAALCLAHAACAPSESLPQGDDTTTSEDGLRVCAGKSTLKGLDVSVYNGHVTWSKVKGAGYSFAFARVSDGLNHLDSEFAANWSGIKAAGMVRGAYQYFRPSQDAVAQADLFVSKLGALGAGDLPPVIDVETDDGVSGSTVVKGVRAWIDRVKAKTGRDPIVYAAEGFWDTLPNTAQFATSKLWVANYGASCPIMPQTWKAWVFWQTSESGKVSGMSGAVDLDTFNGTLADLQALATPPAAPACSTDADCPSGSTCDTSGPAAFCAPSSTGPLPLGAACTSDAQCGGPGQGKVCSNQSHTCIAGCHQDSDCAAGKVCDETQSPWQCAAPAPPPPTCPVLAFPSGIHVQTVENAAMTASYQGHLKAGETAPKCFLDVGNLHDPVAQMSYDLSVHVAAHFQLVELVGTEVNQGYGNFVLLSPAAVQSLEAFREGVGGPVTVNSGFRSPKHQEDVCNSLCGNPYGCSGTCSNNSRHMWGDAFDLPTNFYSSYYTNMACQDGFKFTYLESGTHLHVDQNPAYAQCVMQ